MGGVLNMGGGGVYVCFLGEMHSNRLRGETRDTVTNLQVGT